MKLVRAVSCWGNEASPREALALALQWNFEAVEGPAPDDPASFGKAVREAGKSFIAEISTCCAPGEYVPSLRATVADHLEDFKRQLDAALPAEPLFITTLAGADFWDFRTARDFLADLLEIAKAAGTIVRVETHRARPTFHPSRTARLLAELPELFLTLDVSHWCVVCERLVPDIPVWMAVIEPRVGHIHARVGYAQGPQVPDPRAPWHATDLAAHLACWKRIAMEPTTVTPEFGPDGYLQRNPVTGGPCADLRELNRWMGNKIASDLAG